MRLRVERVWFQCKKERKTDISCAVWLEHEQTTHSLIQPQPRQVSALVAFHFTLFSVFLLSRHASIQDSYLLNYFSDMNEVFRVGSPVYFVVKDGFDYANNVNKVSRFRMYKLQVTVIHYNTIHTSGNFKTLVACFEVTHFYAWCRPALVFCVRYRALFVVGKLTT